MSERIQRRDRSSPDHRRNDSDWGDRVVGVFDRALRAVAGVESGASKPSPAAQVEDEPLTRAQRRHAAGLMRVNHAGEIAAQALYHGQALGARDPSVRAAMEKAAVEEGDHLAWCRQRLSELDAAPSRLDPFWYAASFAIGALAARAGDRYSLGFVAETERQVVEHLDRHIERLPPADRRSRRILERMRADEQAHATGAIAAGGVPLPWIVRRAMRHVSKSMTSSAYYF
ncbi:MAG: 2-polyprenyl-3-methyl-6-methoxy-1,4-benzoquinone monooxygenase [Ectothiorhodospiraceae bacterium AqS1]|nr:2-polyprenyl-3-methyl-6-methoxy-1,4-benzoquinone monooxygenase [Ectothiorhodospiraceae bacterium AqS1]